MEQVKLPPQAIELEMSVLGTIMNEPGRLSDVADFLIPEMFYKSSHQKIYRSILSLVNSGQPYDLISVTERLRSNGDLSKIEDGVFYITSICEKSTGLQIEHHGRVVLEKYILREIIRVCSELRESAFNGELDVFDMIEKAEDSLISITGRLIKNSGYTIASLLAGELKQLQARIESTRALVGIGSGFTQLDRVTNGWQTPNLAIIAARPGMGKTAFALIAARNAAIDFNVPTVLFSLEMSASQLTQRLMASESEVNFSWIQSGSCRNEYEAIFTSCGKLSNAKLFIDDTEALSLFELRSKARKLKMKQDIGLIFIDYLQLMRGEKAGNREQEISSISRGLKSLAKELNVPVIALAQLSRACEARSDKRPILSDLRESGSIEQDADIVGFLYRPSYYKEVNSSGDRIPENVLELNIAKHRNGAITYNPMILNFNQEIVKITGYEKEYNQNPF